MIQIFKAPVRAGDAETEANVPLLGGDGNNNQTSYSASPAQGQNGASPAVRAAMADLHRDFVAESLRVASIKAVHGVDNIALGDDLNAERDIRIAVEKHPRGCKGLSRNATREPALTARPSYLQLVYHREPPPRPEPRLAVRVSVCAGTARAPYGRSRVFRLRPRDLDDLLRHAEQLERRACRL
jgi:hypothetical protein